MNDMKYRHCFPMTPLCDVGNLPAQEWWSQSLPKNPKRELTIKDRNEAHHSVFKQWNVRIRTTSL